MIELPIVEVRDKNFNRVGVLDFSSCELAVSVRFNNVGDWELRIPADDMLADAVRTPGAGIICYFNGRVISGWTRSAELAENAEDPIGSWTVTGVTDEAVLAARVTFPNPSLDADVQDTAYWQDSGPFESVAKELVDRNLGGSALGYRQLVQVAADQARGETVILKSRFKNVLEELQSLAILGGLGFTVVQNGPNLEFEVYTPVDRSREIQLDVENGGLSSAGWGYEAPASTYVFPAGQGQGAERTIKKVSTQASLDAANDWGFSIEVFKDQRNTDDGAELDQAGLEILAESGTMGRVIKIEPSDSPFLRPGSAFWLGDTVTVSSTVGNAQAEVSEVLFLVNSRDGVAVSVSVGDPTGFSFEARLGERVELQERRITQLERSAEGGSVLPVPSSSGLVLFSDNNLAPMWDSLPAPPRVDYRVVANIAERDAISNPYPGLKVFVQATNAEYAWKFLPGSTGWDVWDTGWISLTGFASGWDFPSTVPAYRRVGKMVTFRGFLRNATFSGGYTQINTVPVGFRPSAEVTASARTNTTAGLTLRITVSGDFFAYSSAASAAWWQLSGLSYFID